MDGPNLMGTFAVPKPLITDEEIARKQANGTGKHEKPAKQPKEKPKRRNEFAERFRTFNAFVDGTLAGIARTDALVWFVIFRHAKDGISKVSQSRIAQQAGVSKRTVVSAIQRLAHLGLLDVIYKGRFRKGVSVYKVHGGTSHE